MWRKFFYRFGAATASNHSKVTQIGQIKAESVYIGQPESSSSNSKGRFSNLPLQCSAAYVEREPLQLQLKSQLHDVLEKPSLRSIVVVIQGLGGAGKTQLILHYIQEYQADYEGIFWLKLSGRQAAEREILLLYRWLFELQNTDISTTPSFEESLLRIKSWFQGRSGKWLWVIDNADNVDNPTDPDYIDLITLIPQSPSVHVVITTRSTLLAGIASSSSPIDVRGLSNEQALRLFWNLTKINPETRSPADIQKARDIVQELGYLALAITLAGKTIFESPSMKKDLALYLNKYRSNRQYLLSKKPEKIIDQYGESIITSWEISYSNISHQSKLAANLLGFLALLNRDDISLEIFEIALEYFFKGKNPDEDRYWESVLVTDDNNLTIHNIESALGILRRYSLSYYDENIEAYTMHRIVQAWGFERLDGLSKLEVCRAVCDFVCIVIENCKPEPMFLARIAKHAMQSFKETSRLFQSEDRDDQFLLSIVDRWTTFTKLLDKLGLWNDSAEMVLYSLYIRKRLQGRDNLRTIAAMSDLAITLNRQGKLDQAESIKKEVLEKRQRILGDKHLDTISTMHNLAITLREQGKLDEAELMGKEVLKKSKQILGDEHPDTISAMNNLAITLKNQEKLDEAELMQREVLEKRKRILRDEHPDTISAINNLAATLGNQGKLDEAGLMIKEVLKKRKWILGDEHPDTISAMENLAISDKHMGRLKSAIGALEEVLSRRKKLLGEHHPATQKTASLLSKYSNLE